MRPREPERLPGFSLDDGLGPAAPLSELAAARLVGGAIDQVFATPSARRRLGPWLAAAAVVLLAGVPAGAAIWRFVWPPPAPTRAARRHLPAPPAAAPLPEPEAAAVPEVAPSSRRPRRAPAHRSRQGGPLAELAAPAPSAAQLLDLASRQRGARQWAAAARTYDRLVAAHPDTGAAYVARVAWATLALEHLGRPEEAARSFAAALRARLGGPLDAEARWGLARACRALGQTAAEREALDILLRDHPASAYADLAHARLDALESR